MKILILVLSFLFMLSACDRSKGKGSDTQWQERQEEKQLQKDLQKKIPPEHSYEYIP